MNTNGERRVGTAVVKIRVGSWSNSSWKRARDRFLGLLLVFAIGAGILLPAIHQKRTERRVRAMLLAVQEGLQRYHVKEELYPKRMMKGHELVELLKQGGHLDGPIVNPWTGRDYLTWPHQDWLRYRTDGLAETYELIGLSPGTEEVAFRLDSTKHQSLE